MTRVLSFHARYGCRERGLCCTSGWPIAAEAGVVEQAERAVADGRIDGVVALPFIRPAHAPNGTPAILATTNGACVFHRAEGAGRCALHRSLGHAALPLACRQFPRVSVIDPRGVSVTLSHFCPTAADLLDAPGSVAIVDRAPAFPEDSEYVGLDVRQGLPPLLRPDMLSDWEAWWRWERGVVALLAAAATPDEAFARLSVAVERVRPWTPASGPLETRVDEALHTADSRPPATARHRREPTDVANEVLAAIPDEFSEEAARALATRGPIPSPRAHLAFLAAHTFANWTAHLGTGLRTWLRSIETAHALVSDGIGVRQVDLLLRHLADPNRLAQAWSRAEDDADSRG